MSDKVMIIFNPHSDRGRSWNIASSLQSVLSQFPDVRWTATEYPTHATELALEAGKKRFKKVVAVGGDGTVHETVNGLMQIPERKRPLLAAVPIGSGNDFCANIGIHPDPEKAVQRVFSGEIRRIDLGRITDETGRSAYWDNTLGIGFDAVTTARSYRITWVQGTLMYLIAVIQTILRDHVAPTMQIETDQEMMERQLLMCTLCNGPREGGGFHVAPGAVPDDGILDYVLVDRVSRLKMFRLIPEFMRGTHGRFPEVTLGQCKHMRITSELPMVIHTDGEIFAGSTSSVHQVDIEILPQAIDVVF